MRLQNRSGGCTFLCAFLPRRSPGAEEYPVPQWSDQPSIVLRSADEVLELLELSPSEPYAIYWNGVDSGAVPQAMLFFTRDGAMIAGVVSSDSEVKATLVALAGVVGARFGYMTGEAPPPETRDEFIALCRESTLLCIVEGAIRGPIDFSARQKEGSQ